MRSKKFVIAYAVVIFLIVFLITFNCVCSITQISVTFTTGSPQMSAAATDIQKDLETKYLKKNFLFFNASDVIEVVAEKGDGYLEVTSVEKHFPNKITVTVREKFETYAYSSNGKYYVVSEEGVVLKVKDANESNLGGSNIEVVGFEFGDYKEGDLFGVSESQQQAYEAYLEVCGVLNEAFGTLRSNIRKIEYFGERNIINNLTLTTVEGVQILISDCTEDAAAKAQEAADFYLNECDTAQRMRGYIRVDKQDSGKISVSYLDKRPPEWVASSQS